MIETNYSLPVHKSIQVVDLPLGIGVKPLMTLLVLLVLGVNLVSWWVALVVMALYLVLRMLCKNDPYLLEIIFDNLWQQDEYLG